MSSTVDKFTLGFHRAAKEREFKRIQQQTALGEMREKDIAQARQEQLAAAGYEPGKLRGAELWAAALAAG